MRFTIFLVFVLSLSISNAQMINKWTNVYKEEGSFLDFSRQNNLECLDEENILLIDQYAANTGAFLTVSSNGGKTWNKVFTTKGFQHSINSIAYPSKQRMIWVGDTMEFQGTLDGYNYKYKRSGIICKSYDAGANWTKTKLDSNTILDYVVMLNDSVGLINKRNVTNRYNNNISFYDTLLYSEDFFETYVKIPVPDSLTFVSKIYMFSKDHFIIETSNSRLERYVFMETTDRGKNWTDFMEGGSVTDLVFIDNNNLYKIEVKPIPNTSSYYSVVYRTTNRGINWDSCFSASDPYWQEYYVYRISAPDSLNAIAIGSSCTIYSTSDGGKTWLKEYAPNLDGGIAMEYDNMFYVDYIKKEIAYIVGAGYLFKMDGEKILSKPRLNRYTTRVDPNYIPAFWKPVQGAEKYRLQVAGDNDNVFNFSDFDILFLDTIITDTAFIIKGMEYDRCYYGRVKAISGDLESDWDIKASMFCTKRTPESLEVPQFITPYFDEILPTGKCDFKWTSVYDADRYELQLADNLYFANTLFSREDITDTTLTIDNLFHQKYYARLRAKKGVNYSDWIYLEFSVKEPTSVNDEEFEISIFPNPANTYVEINLEDENISDFVIYNTFGQELIKQSSKNIIKPLRINISELPSGIYFIRSGKKIGKFIKGY